MSSETIGNSFRYFQTSSDVEKKFVRECGKALWGKFFVESWGVKNLLENFVVINLETFLNFKSQNFI